MDIKVQMKDCLLAAVYLTITFYTFPKAPEIMTLKAEIVKLHSVKIHSICSSKYSIRKKLKDHLWPGEEILMAQI